MYNKEVFFDLKNLDSFQNIFIKTLKLDSMQKKSNKKNKFYKGGSEGPTMFKIIKDNKIDKENLYIIKYNGGLYKLNIKSLEYTFLKDTPVIIPYLDVKLNKYYLFKIKNNWLQGAPIFIIKNNKRSQKVPLHLKNDIEQFYTVKQQEDNYFMKVDDEIYVYGNYYRIYFNYTVKNTDGTTITKNRDTGIDTSTTKDTEFIEFKDGTFVIKHKNITKNVSIDQKYKGIQGIQGATGAGTQGTTGTQGRTGAQGAQGIQGTQGTQGITGAGTQETIGSQGAQGKLIDIKFYYDFRRHYLIYLETDNQYNININNFNDLITCNNKVILKKVYSALHASDIYGKEMVVEGIVSRNEDNHEKTIYECTNGFTGVKNSYFRAYSTNDDLILDPKNKIFGLSDIKKFIKTPYSYFYNSDAPFSIVFHNNTYFAYFRLNTKIGGRQIQYTTSKDMINWDEYKILKIKGFDLDINHIYHPNIFKYENTKYLIGIIIYHNVDIQRLSYSIIMSRDGINFKVISTILSFYSSGIHYINKEGEYEDFFPFMNGLFEYNNRLNLYFYKILYKEIKFILYEYSCHIDELFYLTTDYHGTCCTKLIKVINNKIFFNYKCRENGYIKVKLIDKYHNNIDGFNFTDFDTLTNNNYEIKAISWKNISQVNKKYVYIHIEIFNSNIYSISGKFYESNKYFNHLIYKVNDLSRKDGFLEGKSENYLNINLLDKYGMNVKEIMGEIEYNEDNTKAYINIRLVDDSKERIILHDSTDDIIKHNDLSFKRPIRVFSYKLINIPLDK